MDNTDNKIKLEDITFEDVIGDGIPEAVEESAQEEVTEAKLEDVTLDEDILELTEKVEEVEEVKEEVVLEKKKKDVEPEIETVEDTLVSEIATTFGFELENEYDDTPEGLTNMTKELATKVAESQLDKLFQTHPDVKEHLEYVMNGGDSRQFLMGNNAIKDLADFTVDISDVTSQQAVMAEYLKIKGHEQEFITDLISDYADSDKLFEKAQKAKVALVKYQKDVKTKQLEEQAVENRESEKNQKEFWDGVKGTISENKEFKGISIQERDKSDFFDFLSKPINPQGETKRDSMYADADVETKLAIDYLLFKGFDLTSIVQKKAKTQAAKSLRSRLKTNKDKIKTAGKGVRASSGNFDVDDLELDLGNWS